MVKLFGKLPNLFRERYLKPVIKAKFKKGWFI